MNTTTTAPHRVTFVDHRPGTINRVVECGTFADRDEAWEAMGHYAAGFARAGDVAAEHLPELLAVHFWHENRVVAEYYAEAVDQ